MPATTLALCTDCTMAQVNNDYSGMSEERAEEVRNALAEYPSNSLTFGLDDCDYLECVEDINNGVFGDSHDIEHDTINFSYHPCDTCRSRLGGTRHYFTYWPED